MKLVVASVLLVAAGSTAHAADHLAKVGEVLLSNQGNASSQFIEIEDPAGESFPNAPYSVEIFNAAGVSQGSVALNVPAGTTRLLIATATAATQFSVTPAAVLTIALPTNGQACFKNNTGGVNGGRIHCLAWGTITTTVNGGTNNTGASPGDGMSLQRVNGVYTIGTPSPGAANTAVLPDAPPGVDAGVDAPNTSQDADTVTPDAPTGGGNNSGDDDGCNVGASASWFALVGFAAMLMLRRRKRD